MSLFKKIASSVLVLTIFYSQDLFAFNAVFIPSAIPSSLVGVSQIHTAHNPDKSGLIGAPITGALNSGFNLGFDNGNAIIAGINDGLLRGVVSLGIEFATQKINPLLGA